MNEELGPCVEWQGSLTKSGGYGQKHFNGSPRRVHRLAWEEAHGPIPDGLCVLHKCDNPKCYRVEHLFLGTRADNNRDKAEKGRSNRKPTVLGSKNKSSKLTEEQVRDAMARARRGENKREIAAEMGVDYQAIYSISVGKTWRWLFSEEEYACDLVKRRPSRARSAQS